MTTICMKIKQPYHQNIYLSIPEMTNVSPFMVRFERI